MLKLILKLLSNFQDNSAINQTDRIVMIGTASKGIIERQHQHNAQVYPFLN